MPPDNSSLLLLLASNPTRSSMCGNHVTEPADSLSFCSFRSEQDATSPLAGRRSMTTQVDELLLEEQEEERGAGDDHEDEDRRCSGAALAP